MVDNKVVIRINYDKDKYRKEVIDPKMVTVWHKGRIFFALLLMSSLIVALLMLFGGNSVEESGGQSPLLGIESVSDSAPKNSGANLEKEKVNGENVLSENVPSIQTIIVSKPVGIILNKRVIRASINRSVDDSSSQSTVIVDSVIHLDQNSNQQPLNYFSEVKGVKESSLYHRWLKNGQIVHVRQFTIKDRKGKLLSSRKLGSKDVGHWEVMLIDKHEKVWSRSAFEVSQR